MSMLIPPLPPLLKKDKVALFTKHLKYLLKTQTKVFKNLLLEIVNAFQECTYNRFHVRFYFEKILSYIAMISGVDS